MYPSIPHRDRPLDPDTLCCADIRRLMPDPFGQPRLQMVREQLEGRGICDPHVLAAMGEVPRHEFVSQELRADAYEDHPLPIGGGQTISQPYIVGVMLQHLALAPEDRVLEVGTGSGYATAVLSRICARVFSVERRADLAEGARTVLTRLGYAKVEILVGDGALGLPQHAPFDAILVSAAAPAVPPALFSQLREGGRIIVPVGSPNLQQLQLVRKMNGEAIATALEGCRFVPLVEGSPETADEFPRNLS